MLTFQETSKLLAQSDFFYTIAMGLDGKYFYVSRNYAKNFNLNNKSLLGKHFAITLHPDDVSICEKVAEKCFKAPGYTFPATLRKLDGKGGFIFTQWEIQTIKDENDNIIGVFCIGYNISPFIIAQDQLKDANIEIETNKNRFQEIGFMQSHGVRRPLANIMGLVEILNTMTLEPNVNNIKDMIGQSANELDKIIKDVIDLTYPTK